MTFFGHFGGSQSLFFFPRPAIYPTAALTPVTHSTPQPPPILQQREGKGLIEKSGTKDFWGFYKSVHMG